jgi:hypothetical protein
MRVKFNESMVIKIKMMNGYKMFVSARNMNNIG